MSATSTASPPRPQKHDPYAALREPNYRYFAGGWVLASMGLQMQGTALAWEVYDKTSDPLSLGFVSLARALPVLALALPAGQIVDLLDRRKVLMFTQVGFALTSLFLCLGSAAGVSVAWIYILVALTGCARVFNGPSRASLLPQIVRPERFHNAVAWNSGVFQFAAMVGPLAAGGLIWFSAALGMGRDGAGAAHGVAWPVYGIAALSSLALALGCTMVRPYPDLVRRAAGGISIGHAVRPSVLLPGMLEGARHVWREKTVFGAIALDLLAVLLGGATALMPVYARDILHVGPVGLGALRSAPFVGALAVALLLAHRRPFEHAGRTLLLCVAGFGACTVGFGFSTNLGLSLALLVSLGALDGVSVVIRHVLVSVRTPDALRGRVSAVNSVFIESSNELGGFESGLVARLFTPLISVVSGGIGTIAIVIVVAWWLPDLRRLGRLGTPKTGVQEAIEEQQQASV
ncbi:MAG: MFS transporter [Phycisphaerales bacterium]|nr:MFS transporter [Phycisphaerales bacterium]